MPPASADFQSSAVQSHYGRPTLIAEVLDALERAGLAPDALSNNLDYKALRTIDAFHLRGAAATQALAELANLKQGQSVLDVGSGIGGTARHLATEYGSRVTGVDITSEYCALASKLSEFTGMSDRTRFVQGSALQLPFPESEFDVVWTEHVQMNIADKAGFYTEAARVLRNGGRLAFHDIFAGAEGSPLFPVPWAATASISHLATAPDARATIAGTGLQPLDWLDVTAEAMDFLRQALAQQQGPAQLGLHQLMGEGAAERFANLLTNLEQRRVAVVQSVWQKPI